MHGALAWRALVKRYASSTAPRMQSLMSAILNVKAFPSELTACETALGEWQKNIRKCEIISGNLFNESMKKAFFLDKAPSRVRILFQIQNLDTFELMKTVTLQVLQRNAQYQADVTVLRDNEREESNDMEIDALTKEGSSHKGKGKSRAERQKSSCSGCGQRHMNRESWFKQRYKQGGDDQRLPVEQG